jgi:hypothetical protein
MVINIVLLAAGPILLLILAYTKHVVVHGRLLRQLPSTAQEDGSQESIWRRLWNSFKAMTWLGNLWIVGKFWVALLIGIGLQVLLVLSYVKLNPFVRKFPLTSYSPLTNKFTYPDRLFPSIPRPRINTVVNLPVHGSASRSSGLQTWCSSGTTKSHCPLPDIYLNLGTLASIHNRPR